MISISAVDFAKLASSVNILDVRDVKEYATGHVPNAMSMPLSLIPLRVSELRRSETYYLICQTGGRSAQAYQYLTDQGYDVVNVLGGTSEWIALGNSVSRD